MTILSSEYRQNILGISSDILESSFYLQDGASKVVEAAGAR